jgi:hypothetical protein
MSGRVSVLGGGIHAVGGGGHPERHVWGLGRHYVGSNFFWYLRDPAGNFSVSPRAVKWRGR